MIEPRKPASEQLVACEICLKEVPISEAKCPEAVEYVLYFCGLECCELWREQEAQAKREREEGKA
jgi:hypothetical protein